MRYRVNGREVEYLGDPARSLLDVLREDLDLTSAKNGCAPQAACGCCTVLLAGKPVMSCAVEMRRVENAEVVTLEGLDAFERDVLAGAFAGHGGVQCGFCAPGIVMRSHALLQANPEPTREQITRALDLHLCRCTGWVKIVTSIEAAAVALRTRTLPAMPRSDGRLGSRLIKVGARELALGQVKFAADIKRPGLLHGALRLAGVPRARVLSIDPTAALALPGVERVILAGDVPGHRYHGLLHEDWPLYLAPGEEVHYAGDTIAAVVAQTAAIARQAAALIDVRLELLTPVTDMDAALLPGAPMVHPDGNLLGRVALRKGEGAQALLDCAFVVRGVWHTQRIEHAYLEPECALAEPLAPGRAGTPGGVRVTSEGQGIYEDRRQIARLLGLPETAVEVVLTPSGGAFGGKEDLTTQGHAAVAAFLLQRPVRFEFSRPESILVHPKRHPMRMELAVGCTSQGELHALDCRIVGDNGCYSSVGAKVLERAAGHATGAYHVPHVDVEALAIATNHSPSGAMRGFGANQATFALECAIDQLCELGGFDRWQFRWNNALIEGRSTATGQVLEGGVGVRPCLEAVRDRFREARFAGLACALKNTGIGNGVPDIGRAMVRVLPGPRVEIHHGWSEMGQGVDTVAVQMLCETTGIDPALVSVVVDTHFEVPAGMTTASRGTSLVGHGVRAAGLKLAADLQTVALAALIGRDYRGEWVCDWTTGPGGVDGKPPVTHYSYSYAAQVAILDDAGKVEEIIAAHDVGRIVNPTLFEGQVEGSVHMGLGYAMTEDLPMAGGLPVSLKLRDCGVLRASEMPRVTVIGLEIPCPNGPYGAKGVGEIGLVPTAPAVANALYMFDGVRRFRLPMARRRRKKELAATALQVDTPGNTILPQTGSEV